MAPVHALGDTAPSLRGPRPEASDTPDLAEHYMKECIRMMRGLSTGRSASPPATESSEVPLGPGSTVDGRYHIVELLGRGGMGSVFKAHDPRLRRMVALKVARPGSEAHGDRFVAEARICSRIRHRNIVELYDVGTLPDGRPYYTMELVAGRDLATILRDEPVPATVAVTLLRQVATALARVHRAGVVHRDVKPANVMINEAPVQSTGGALCKLVDFGLAYEHSAQSPGPADAAEPHTTRDSRLMGTPLYMSPEQIEGQAVDARSDIYGFGCLAFELLTGSPPFTADNVFDVLDQHVHADPPPLRLRARRANARVQAALQALVHRCLAKRPEDRPASMAEIKAELAAIRFGTPAAA